MGHRTPHPLRLADLHRCEASGRVVAAAVGQRAVGCPAGAIHRLERRRLGTATMPYGGVHSHGGTPIAGWFIING